MTDDSRAPSRAGGRSHLGAGSRITGELYFPGTVELPGHGPEFVTLTRGAERASADEIERNPRSAPVRLRALEKVGGQKR